VLPTLYGGTVIIQVLHCPYCQGIDIVRHGTTLEGKQRYRCRECLLGRAVLILPVAQIQRWNAGHVLTRGLFKLVHAPPHHE
jgi:hypothetical protein